MAQIFTTSRAEVALVRFPTLFYPLVIGLALVGQAYLPVLVHAAIYLDLPLLVVVYCALSTRHQAASPLLGAFMGLLQDSLAHAALGLNGMAKTLVGYFNAALGSKIDSDHSGIRFILVLGCYYANVLVVHALKHYLLAQPVPWQGLITFVAAFVNASLAVVLFGLFDRFRQRR